MITGGASGIGRALAYRFADDGAEGIVVADLDQEGATDVATDLGQRDRGRLRRRRSAPRGRPDLRRRAVLRAGRPVLRQRGRRRRRQPGHARRLGPGVRRQRPRPHRGGRAPAARLAGARERVLPHDGLGGGHREPDRLRALRGHQARRRRLRRMAEHHLRRPRRRRQLPVPDGRQHAAADRRPRRRGQPRLPRRHRRLARCSSPIRWPTPSSTVSPTERFLILPHPEVLEFFQRKAADYDRWLAGMRRLQARVEALERTRRPRLTR